MNDDEEQAAVDRGSRAWQASKNRKRIKKVRPTLDRLQRIEFLELVSQMASRSVFERKLSLDLFDVEFYKRELDIESPAEARRLAGKLKRQGDDEREARLLEQTQKVQEAQEIAQARLEALIAKKAVDQLAKPSKKVDINQIRQEDADRQRRFAAQQEQTQDPAKKWHLPMVDGAGSEAEQIDKFRRDIVYRGLSFVGKKYDATPSQVKFEAKRLGISVNWDIVRR